MDPKRSVLPTTPRRPPKWSMYSMQFINFFLLKTLYHWRATQLYNRAMFVVSSQLSYSRKMHWTLDNSTLSIQSSYCLSSNTFCKNTRQFRTIRPHTELHCSITNFICQIVSTSCSRSAGHDASRHGDCSTNGESSRRRSTRWGRARPAITRACAAFHSH